VLCDRVYDHPVSLGAAKQDAQAVRGLLHVGHVQGDQLGAPEGAGEGQHRSARSRRPALLAPSQAASIRRSSSVEIPALLACAVPIVRRIPASVAFTVSSRVGGGLTPATWWALEVAATRRAKKTALSPCRKDCVVSVPRALADPACA
jgi:hypothetical protein